MIIVYVLLAVVIIGALGIFAAAFVLMRIAAKPRRYSAGRSLKQVKEQGLYGEFDSLFKEEIQIPSYDKYVLHGLYLPAKEESNRYVVITHGIMDTCYGSVKYANMYHRLGFHVVMYDLRNHGANGRTYTSMGVRECKDLRAVIEYVRERFGAGDSQPEKSSKEDSGNISIGIHGESLGSATSILCLNNDLKLAFCVADCGYSDFIALTKHLVKNEYHVPDFFVPLGDKIVKFFYGYSFSEIRPIDNLKNNHTPILFIHGAADTYIPPYMSQDMYDANAGYKEICFFEGAKHAKSAASDPKRYFEVLRGFLERVFSG